MSLFNAEKLNKRNTSLDIVRIVALFCVIGVHFFLNSDFYSQKIIGTNFLFMCILRTAFMVCVPLFIILTGYLMNKKELSGKYYKGIIKTLGIYVLASIVCLIFKATYLGYDITLKNSILGILGFTACDYSWYIEMYIGLFLLIPFLNLIYNNLKSKKEKGWLILTFLFLTSIPTITNIYNFSVKGWITNPSVSNEYSKLIPFWWQMIYPLTYYFIGAYISEFKPKMNKLLNFVLFIVTISVFGLFNYYRSYGSTFARGIYESWGSVQNTILSTLLFLLIYNIKTERFPIWIKGILKYLSDISLGGYLLSVIVDKIAYNKLNAMIPVMQERIKYFIIVVPAIFIASLILSGVVNFIYNVINKVIIKINSFRKV